MWDWEHGGCLVWLGLVPALIGAAAILTAVFTLGYEAHAHGWLR